MSDSSQTTTLLPPRFEDADLDHLVVLIADMLQRLIIHNDKIPLSPESLTRFHSRSPPTITVLEYLRRVAKYTNVERTCLIITLHYIDRICARIARFTISSLTVHRFIISSITVSSKALCDVFCTNSFYAKVGGLRVMELNVLEKELLSAIDWRLTCTRELLQEYYVNLVRTHSFGQYKIEEQQQQQQQTSPHSDCSSGKSKLAEELQTTPRSDISRSPRSATPVNNAPPPPVPPGEMMEGQQQDLVEHQQHQHQHQRHPLVPAEPSSVLMGKAVAVSPPSSPLAQTGPTALEQNMAFAALQVVVMSPCVGGSVLRPEKRTGGHLVDPSDVDNNIRPVKRKLGA